MINVLKLMYLIVEHTRDRELKFRREKLRLRDKEKFFSSIDKRLKIDKDKKQRDRDLLKRRDKLN